MDEGILWIDWSIVLSAMTGKIKASYYMFPSFSFSLGSIVYARAWVALVYVLPPPPSPSLFTHPFSPRP